LDVKKQLSNSDASHAPLHQEGGICGLLSNRRTTEKGGDFLTTNVDGENRSRGKRREGPREEERRKQKPLLSRRR
jgi:hypothetical protein